MTATPAVSRPLISRPLRSLARAAVLGLSLTSCAKYAQLKQTTPPFTPATATGESLTTVAKTLEGALKVEKQNPGD